MNLGTRDIKAAGLKAQELANMRGRPVVVFTPATGVGGPLWEDSCPNWHNEAMWVEIQMRQGHMVYFPDPRYCDYKHLKS